MCKQSAYSAQQSQRSSKYEQQNVECEEKLAVFGVQDFERPGQVDHLSMKIAKPGHRETARPNNQAQQAGRWRFGDSERQKSDE